MLWFLTALAASPYVEAVEEAHAFLHQESVDQVLYRQAREQLAEGHLYMVRSLLREVADPNRRELLTRLVEVEAVTLGVEDDLPLLTASDPGRLHDDFAIAGVWSDCVAMHLSPERRKAAVRHPRWVEMASRWIERGRPERASALLLEMNAIDKAERSQIHALLAIASSGEEREKQVWAAASAAHHGGVIETGAEELQAMVDLLAPLASIVPASHPVFDDLARRIRRKAENRFYEDHYDDALADATAFYVAHSDEDPWYRRSLDLDRSPSQSQRLKRARARRSAGDATSEAQELDELRKNERVRTILELLYPEHADLIDLRRSASAHWRMIDAARARGVDTSTLEPWFERPAPAPSEPPEESTPTRRRYTRGAEEALLSRVADHLRAADFEKTEATIGRYLSGAIEDDRMRFRPYPYYRRPYWMPRSGRLRRTKAPVDADVSSVETDWMVEHWNSEGLFETSLLTDDPDELARLEGSLRSLIRRQRPEWREQHRQHLVGVLIRSGQFEAAMQEHEKTDRHDSIGWIADERVARGLKTDAVTATRWIEALAVPRNVWFPPTTARRVMAAVTFRQPPETVRARLALAEERWSATSPAHDVDMALLHGAAFGGLHDEADRLLTSLLADHTQQQSDQLVTTLLEAREAGFWRPDAIASMLPDCRPQTWQKALSTVWEYDDQARSVAWWSDHAPSDPEDRDVVWRTQLYLSDTAPDPLDAVWTIWDPEPRNISHLRDETAALAAALLEAGHPDASAVEALIPPLPDDEQGTTDAKPQ